MEEHIDRIKQLIDENLTIKERTPWLDISLGALRTALHNLDEHLAALARIAAAPAAAGDPRPPAPPATSA